jgi:hypothetical protein
MYLTNKGYFQDYSLKKPITGLDFLSYMTDEILIIGDVTIYEALVPLLDCGELNLILSADLYGIVCQMHRDDINDTGIEYISIQEHTTIFDSNYGENWVDRRIDASGKKSGEITSYALELTKLAKLKNLPVRIDKQSKLSIIDKDYKEKTLIEFEVHVTFFDFLLALMRELAWMPDEEKDGFIKDLETSIEGIDNGTVKTISWEEVIEGLHIEDKE